MSAASTQTQADAQAERLYEERILPLVNTAGNLGKTVVFDLRSGEFEVDEVGRSAAHRLRVRRPDGLFYAYTIGFDADEGIGGGDVELKP